MTGRAVAEWIGKTPDSPVPPRVRLRVLERYGRRCYLSGRPIRPGDAWQAEHIIALINWTGEGHGNRESNLAPALAEPHKAKTAKDMAEKSAGYRTRAAHLGATRPRSKLQSRGFEKAPPQRTATRPLTKPAAWRETT